MAQFGSSPFLCGAQVLPKAGEGEPSVLHRWNNQGMSSLEAERW